MEPGIQNYIQNYSMTKKNLKPGGSAKLKHNLFEVLTSAIVSNTSHNFSIFYTGLSRLVFFPTTRPTNLQKTATVGKK